MSSNSNDSIGTPNVRIQQDQGPIPWIWEGLIAEGAVTLLSAPEKIGKTTLLSLLLDRRREGGQLLGRTVYPGNTVVCSEEHLRLWALRQPPLDFGARVTFHTPDSYHPTPGAFQRFMTDAGFLAMEGTCDLLVIDTAASFLPLRERNKRILRRTLGELKALTAEETSVLLINQNSNMFRPLAAFADIVVEMAIPRGLGELGGAPSRASPAIPALSKT
jgi:hypothetical protein